MILHFLWLKNLFRFERQILWRSWETWVVNKLPSNFDGFHLFINIIFYVEQFCLIQMNGFSISIVPTGLSLKTRKYWGKFTVIRDKFSIATFYFHRNIVFFFVLFESSKFKLPRSLSSHGWTLKLFHSIAFYVEKCTTKDVKIIV